MKRLVLATILATLIFSGIASPVVNAQSGSGGGQALEIGPPVLNLTGDPGQVINAKINIRDVSQTDLIVTSEINDFVASGEDGTPKIVLDNSTESAFSIRSWIQPLDQLTLKPKQVQSIPVTIFIPTDASPGGYYGIVRFTGIPTGVDGSGVALNASLGTLIFVRVNGDAKEEVTIDDFYANSGGNEYPIFEFKPLTLSVRIKNTGNIYEQPTGLVTVKDMFGKPVVNLPVNAEERIILPDSTRKFDQVIDDSAVGSGLMFGYYTAEVTVKYGSNGQSVTEKTSFWVIPWKLILLGVALLVLAFFVFRILIRRYNRAVVQKATGVKYEKPAKVTKPKASKPAKAPKAPKATKPRK